MLIRTFFRGFHVTTELGLRMVARPMPRTLEEFKAGLTTPGKHEGKQLRVAVIGDPNVGKSTIINKLLSSELCTVSGKAHTTRQSNSVAFTNDDLQVVLVDTPGAVHSLHGKKHNLPSEMLRAPSKVLNQEIDVLVTVVDCSDEFRRSYFSIELLKLLYQHRREQPSACSILVLNKVDKLKDKRVLLKCIETLSKGKINKQTIEKTEALKTKVDLKTKLWQREESRLKSQTEISAEKTCREDASLDKENIDNLESFNLLRAEIDPESYNPKFPPRFESWPYFEKVFIVSALNEDGIDDMKEFLLSKARPGIWKYREDFVSSQKPEELAEDIVKSKILDHVGQEVPYVLFPKVKSWLVEENGTLHIDMQIACKNAREIRALMGKKGSTLKKIIQESREQICAVFACEVRFSLNVDKKPNPYVKK